MVSLFSISIRFWFDRPFSLMAKKPLDEDDLRIYIEGLVTKLIFLNEG